MRKPSNKDILLLKEIEEDIGELIKKYNSLQPETMDFLLNEFTGESEFHMFQIERNIRDTIKEIETRTWIADFITRV